MTRTKDNLNGPTTHHLETIKHDADKRKNIPVAVMHKGKAVSVSAEEALRVVREERGLYTVKQH